MGGVAGTGTPADGVPADGVPADGAPADGAPADVADDVLLARALLSRIAESGCVPLWDAVRRDGPVATVRAIRARTAPDDVLDATVARLPGADPHADLDAAARHGIRLVVPESADWPHFAMACLEATGLRRVAAYRAGHRKRDDAGERIPPLALWVRGGGDLVTSATRSVAVVGARSATRYGERVAADMSAALAERDFVVVSGGAYGIDAAAHRAVLACAGSTVIVSAGGLDRPYPTANSDLYERAAERGLLISESPPGAAPHRHRFLSRNRLIAALSGGTVVVEAARRSGALNTASHCRQLGRPLMAVPGPVTSAMSAGCHDLIVNHPEVALVDGAGAILTLLDSAATLPFGDAADDDGSSRPLDSVDPVARRVYDAFPARRPVSIDALSVVAGVALGEVLGALSALELAGLVRPASGGWRRVSTQSVRPARTA